MPESATACNCTVCRRYGVLWAYDYEGEGIEVSGPTRAYIRGETIEWAATIVLSGRIDSSDLLPELTCCLT